MDRAIVHQAAGGVAIFIREDVYSEEYQLQTDLEAIAVRIPLPVMTTICSLYLPPGQTIEERKLQQLIRQLPQPFLVLGDFNAHDPTWGDLKSDPRGKMTLGLLNQLNVCLLNTGESTHFSIAHGTHSSIDLSVCSPALMPHLRWDVHQDLCDSDHYLINITVLNQEPAVSPRR